MVISDISSSGEKCEQSTLNAVAAPPPATETGDKILPQANVRNHAS